MSWAATSSTSPFLGEHILGSNRVLAPYITL